jgi:Domain of unknown function (DUF4360)
MRLFSSLVAAVSVVVFAGVAGCAAPSSESEETTGGTAEALDVPDPSGVYVAALTANGTGCPAGTWDASISPDGTTFTVSFATYELMVNPGQAFVVKDCQIGIDLKTPSGFTFAVNSFYYQGYNLLDSDGMTAQQTAKYYFMGNPVPGVTFQSNMTGPYDDSYLFANDVPVADLVWSPCGVTRRLNAQTRLILKNNAAKTGSGYLNMSTADGMVQNVFRFGFSWRHC